MLVIPALLQHGRRALAAPRTHDDIFHS